MSVAISLCVGGLLTAIVLVAWLASSHLVITVTGSSMEPAYRDGDRVLVRRTGGVRPGQVVLVRQPLFDPSGHLPGAPAPAPERLLADRVLALKRVAAVEGGPVPAISGLDGDDGRVPEGKLVVLGDHPEASLDSRFLGYFAAADVLGVAVRTLSATRPA
ncbi:S26 family signal peptidase [Actinocorallia longicatena]|uniref:S26 family signal peptidase n=1 Tax=Actinocorallia longicatena TaxID=111803 RepID=A0ABP6QC43_9ACTN